MSLVVGVDVSNWQGTVNWQQVAASGVQFGICKSTEGVTYRDPYFRQNWSGMAAAGIARGSYHFAQPDLNSPEAEAHFWLEHLELAGGLAPGDLLALDLETGYGDVSDWTLRCLGAVAALVGFKPLVYSGRWYMDDHGLTHDEELATHGLWLASYGTVPEPPPFWDFYAIWQFTCEGRVPGVAGPCDMNLANVETIEQLKRYGLPG